MGLFPPIILMLLSNDEENPEYPFGAFPNI
jgi:hypothetical protein